MSWREIKITTYKNMLKMQNTNEWLIKLKKTRRVGQQSEINNEIKKVWSSKTVLNQSTQELAQWGYNEYCKWKNLLG